MTARLFLFLLLAGLWNLSSTLGAEEESPQPEDPKLVLAAELKEEMPERRLRIATYVAPPFVLKNEQGEWAGISIDLWKEMAQELHLDYEFTEMPPADMLLAVESGAVDLAVGPITITAQREAKLDFTHPYEQSGLSLGINQTPESGILPYLRMVFSWGFVSTILAVLFVTLLAGFALRLFTRRTTQDQVDDKANEDAGHASFSSAITKMLFCSRDQNSGNIIGRVIIIIWMCVCVAIISTFTSTVAASIASSAFNANRTAQERLKSSVVGTVEDSWSHAYLDQHRILSQAYPTLLEAMAAVKAGEIDNILYDRPILLYYSLRKDGDFLTLLPQQFGREDYGFALPQGSHRRDEFNQAMLRLLKSEAWPTIRFNYLGAE